ncbi:hypothetical protein BgiMline_025111 [Biomphalaria glabrata]|nr:hypothetical protein BgiMline_008261 [Biomphalaria glabrata]
MDKYSEISQNAVGNGLMIVQGSFCPNGIYFGKPRDLRDIQCSRDRNQNSTPDTNGGIEVTDYCHWNMQCGCQVRNQILANRSRSNIQLDAAVDIDLDLVKNADANQRNEKDARSRNFSKTAFGTELGSLNIKTELVETDNTNSNQCRQSVDTNRLNETFGKYHSVSENVGIFTEIDLKLELDVDLELDLVDASQKTTYAQLVVQSLAKNELENDSRCNTSEDMIKFEENADDMTNDEEIPNEPENIFQDQEENVGETKKFSKSYWRKQRRLRLKERLLAEKMLMENNPDMVAEEKESQRPTKGVKSKGRAELIL